MESKIADCSGCYLLVSLGVASAAAGNIKVIANSNVKAATVSVGELKSIFLEERRSFSEGTHVEPVLDLCHPRNFRASNV